jgi:hypothetical protein
MYNGDGTIEQNKMPKFAFKFPDKLYDIKIDVPCVYDKKELNRPNQIVRNSTPEDRQKWQNLKC